MSMQEVRFLQDDGVCTFRHGLTAPGDDGERVYLLDFDYYDAGERDFELDFAYLHLHVSSLWVAAEREPARVPSLASLARDLKEKVDLPVDDVAAMVGVRRRQFYNLVNGRTASADSEARIRLIHRIVDELDAAVDHDRSRLRAALLMPVGDRFETLHSAAEGGDPDNIRAVGQELV